MEKGWHTWLWTYSAAQYGSQPPLLKCNRALGPHAWPQPRPQASEVVYRELEPFPPPRASAAPVSSYLHPHIREKSDSRSIQLHQHMRNPNKHNQLQLHHVDAKQVLVRTVGIATANPNSDVSIKLQNYDINTPFQKVHYSSYNKRSGIIIRWVNLNRHQNRHDVPIEIGLYAYNSITILGSIVIT